MTEGLEIEKTGVKGESFDMILHFTKGSDDVAFYIDPLLKTLMDGLLEQTDQLLVKINWFSKDLVVLSPTKIPDSDTSQHALQGTQEGSGAMIDSNPSPNTTQEK